MKEETFVALFTQLRARLMSTAARILGDDDEASDALQDAFCRLWARRSNMQSDEELTAMSVRTVQNLCIDQLRQRRVHGVHLAESVAEPECYDESAADRMEREELFEITEKLIKEKLSPLQQTILRMKEYDGCSTAHIAQVLSMQETAVRMNLSRARNAIRESYKNRVQ